MTCFLPFALVLLTSAYTLKDRLSTSSTFLCAFLRSPSPHVFYSLILHPNFRPSAMRAEFPVFSFLSVCILLVALPFKRVRRDIPSTCLLLWLLAWNVIHAVNAVMWAGNAGVRALPWCDLGACYSDQALTDTDMPSVTKVMLAALMGLAGCALCMLRVLEFLASARNPGPNARRNTVSIEVLFCIVIPVIYMLLRTSHLHFL